MIKAFVPDEMYSVRLWINTKSLTKSSRRI
jgi:hypothetical protein